MPAKKKKESLPERNYLINVEIPLPDEHKDLVEGGVIVLYFGEETRDLILDISSELMMSRKLPVDISEIGIEDTMTLWLLRQRGDELAAEGDDAGQAAIEAARHVYSAQIQDCNREAIVLAMTAHTEIKGEFDAQGLHVEPDPATPGEKPLTEKTVGRTASPFVKMVQKRADDIPDVIRNLKNPYESRFQWLHDTISAAGILFYNDTVKAINQAVVDILREIPETDQDGFRPN